MNLQIAQVVGLNTDQKAAQVSSSTRENVTFLSVLKLESDDAFTKGRQSLSELSDFFFESEGSASQKINAAFEEAKNKFKDMEYDLCLGAVDGKILYLIGKGEVEVYLKRAGKISPLYVSGSPSQLISGFINSADSILFATKSLVTFLDADLEKSLSLPADAFKEELEAKIGTSDLENEGLAALAFTAEEQAEESESGEAAAENAGIPVLASEDDGLKEAVFKKIISQAVNLAGKGREYFPKSGRGRLILAAVLIVIIGAGTVYKYKLNAGAEKLKAFNQTFEKARNDFEAAKGLASLNPADAKAKLDSAAGEVNKALVLNSKSRDAEALKKQIEDETPSILQQSEVSSFPEFLDTGLIKKDFTAVKMSLNSGKLLLLDPATKTLVAVDLAKKSNEILAGESQLGDAVFASVNGDLAFVYSKDKGILRTESQKSKVTEVSETDKDWGEIRDIYAFAGNVYLLDSGNGPSGGQIWKYLPASSGYSDKREYLSKNTSANFGTALRMQIESSVYVLKSGGEILRFTKGDKDNFSYSGLPSGVKDPKSFFVSSDTENLYLLDSGNSRLLILTKTGAYKGEIKGAKFATASDLVVDEKGKKVYLLEGSKIYSVDLK